MEVTDKITDLDLKHTIIFGIQLKITDILLILFNIFVLFGCVILNFYNTMKNKYLKRPDSIILGPMCHIGTFSHISLYRKLYTLS